MSSISNIAKMGLKAGGLKDSDMKNGKLVREAYAKLNFKSEKDNLLKFKGRLKY